jgi:hypothetical protein
MHGLVQIAAVSTESFFGWFTNNFIFVHIFILYQSYIVKLLIDNFQITKTTFQTHKDHLSFYSKLIHLRKLP